MKLKEIRDLWEDSNELICETSIFNPFNSVTTVLSVIRDREGYRCLRYFQINIEEDRWEVSVDCDKVAAEVAMKWLCSGFNNY